MHNSRSRSSKVIDIYTKLSINFLLVINSNFGHILHRFRDIAAQRSKNRFFALRTLLWGPRSWGTPSEFLDETYPAETRGMGLLYGENCIILTSNAFDWSTRVTDGQTELPWHIRAIAYMLSRIKRIIKLDIPLPDSERMVYFGPPWIMWSRFMHIHSAICFPVFSQCDSIDGAMWAEKFQLNEVA